MAYSNSVRTGPRLRLLSAIVATSFAMRTLALLPLLFAISPSRIRTLRMTALFQPSLATKNLRSISRLMLWGNPLGYEARWIMQPHRQKKQRDELAPPHSITSSARASSVGGTLRPIALATLRLIANSNLVGA